MRRKASSRGMTLIEILIVVALIALLIGAVAFGSGLMGGAEQRAAASLVVAGVRKGMARANATGRPVRMVFDFEAKTLVLEESSSELAVRSGKESGDPEHQNREAQAILEESKAEAEGVAGGVIHHRPTFAATDLLGDEEGGVRKLGSQVQLRLVQTEHDEEPVTSGKAMIYFWPGGVTERAVVQMGRGDGDGLTVVLSPLTGRARIERGRVELPSGRFDEEFSEREEP